MEASHTVTGRPLHALHRGRHAVAGTCAHACPCTHRFAPSSYEQDVRDVPTTATATGSSDPGSAAAPAMDQPLGLKYFVSVDTNASEPSTGGARASVLVRSSKFMMPTAQTLQATSGSALSLR